MIKKVKNLSLVLTFICFNCSLHTANWCVPNFDGIWSHHTWKTKKNRQYYLLAVGDPWRLQVVSAVLCYVLQNLLFFGYKPRPYPALQRPLNSRFPHQILWHQPRLTSRGPDNLSTWHKLRSKWMVTGYEPAKWKNWLDETLWTFQSIFRLSLVKNIWQNLKLTFSKTALNRGIGTIMAYKMTKTLCLWYLICILMAIWPTVNWGPYQLKPH